MKIEVIEIKDNPDGSAQYIFEVDEEAKASIMKATGMKRWSNKKFQKFVIQALDHWIRLGDSDKL